MEWLLLSEDRAGGVRAGRSLATSLACPFSWEPAPEGESADRFQALAELLEMQLNYTGEELTNLRIRCQGRRSQLSVLLVRFTDIFMGYLATMLGH